MPNGVTARNGGRWGFAALVAIVLLGLGLRVGEAWDGRAPVFDAPAYAATVLRLGGVGLGGAETSFRQGIYMQSVCKNCGLN